jgi:hypothetical protein
MRNKAQHRMPKFAPMKIPMMIPQVMSVHLLSQPKRDRYSSGRAEEGNANWKVRIIGMGGQNCSPYSNSDWNCFTTHPALPAF